MNLGETLRNLTRLEERAVFGDERETYLTAMDVIKIITTSLEEQNKDNECCFGETARITVTSSLDVSTCEEPAFMCCACGKTSRWSPKRCPNCKAWFI